MVELYRLPMAFPVRLGRIQTIELGLAEAKELFEMHIRKIKYLYLRQKSLDPFGSSYHV
jgi:hypothetical protein